MRFAEQWLQENVEDAPAGPVPASDLADRLIAAAIKDGIPADELEDDTGSVFELVFAALEHKTSEQEAASQDSTDDS
jgi:hypothetical protein